MMKQSRLLGSGGLAAIATAIAASLKSGKQRAKDAPEMGAVAAGRSIMPFSSGSPMPYRLPNQRQRRKTARQVNRFPKRKSR